MTEAIWVALIVQAGGILVAIIAGARKLGSIGRDAGAIRKQTENDHGEGAFPNLRDELTSVREQITDMAEAIKGAKQAAELAHSTAERVGTYVADVDTTVRAVRSSLKRRTEQAAEDLRAAVEDRERRIEQVREDLLVLLEQHIRDCARRTKENP